MTRLFYRIFGVILGLFGLLIFNDPIIDDSINSFTFDLTRIRWPFGTFLILFGVFTFLAGSRKKSQKYQTCYYICPICEDTIRLKSDKDSNHQCRTCGVALVELKGFYSRK